MKPSSRNVQAEHKWVTIDGRRMHCIKAGSGPPLILLHGLLGTASAWEPAMDRLASGSTVYAIDALGIGESERGSEIDPGLQAQAQRVVEFMRLAGIPSADFLTSSHGGAVALMLAATYPERVQRLLLQAPANPFSREVDPSIRFYQSPLVRWWAYCIPALPEAIQQYGLKRVYGDASRMLKSSLERYVRSLRIPGTADYILRLLDRWFDDMQKLESALERVRNFPALLLWGEYDRVVSLASGRRLQRCFDRSELVVLPGAGHLPHEECPEMFTEAVTSFLRRHRKSRILPPLAAQNAHTMSNS